jgi:sortase B
VFAAVIYDDTLITAAYDDDDVKDRQAFLDSIFDTRDLNSHVMDDVEVTTEDNIITLSTCIHDVPDKRYLVEAVLVDEQR